MNTAIWQRIVWKELRHQVPIAVVMGAAVWLLGYAVLALRESPWERPTWTVYMLYGMAAVTASAIGGLLFAAEREMRTVQQLRQLPLAGWQVALGKVSAAAVTGIVFLFVIGLAAWRLVPSNMLSGQLVARLLVIVLEFFAWSCLLSLFVQRSLVAMLGGLILGIIVGVQWGAFEWPDSIAYWFYVPGFWDELMRSAPRLLIALGLLAVVGAGSHRWLERATDQGRRQSWSGWVSRMGLRGNHRGVARGRLMGRLLWESLSGAKPLIIAASCALLALGISHLAATWSLQGTLQQTLSATSGGLMLVIGLMWGSTTFSADHQQRSFEFLGQRGVSSSVVFWSRVLPYLAVAALLYGAGTLFMVWSGFLPERIPLLKDDVSPKSAWISMSRSYLAGYVLMLWNGFGLGVLASICLASPVIAVVATLLLMPLVLSWTAGMAWAAVPWWWSSWSVGAVCLVGAWVRVHSRLSSRQSLASQCLPWCVTVASLTALSFGIMAYRVYEVPSAEEFPPLLGSTDPQELEDFERLLKELPAKIDFIDQAGKLYLTNPNRRASDRTETQLESVAADRDAGEIIQSMRELRVDLQRFVEDAARANPGWLVEKTLPRRSQFYVNDHLNASGFLVSMVNRHLREGQLEEAWRSCLDYWLIQSYRSIYHNNWSLTAATEHVPWPSINAVIDGAMDNRELLEQIYADLSYGYANWTPLLSSPAAYELRTATNAVVYFPLKPTDQTFSGLLRTAYRWLPSERQRTQRWMRCARQMYFIYGGIARYLPESDARRQQMISHYDSINKDYWHVVFDRDHFAFLSRTTIPINEYDLPRHETLFNAPANIEYRRLQSIQMVMLMKIRCMLYRIEHGVYPSDLTSLNSNLPTADENSMKLNMESYDPILGMFTAVHYLPQGIEVFDPILLRDVYENKMPVLVADPMSFSKMRLNFQADRMWRLNTGEWGVYFYIPSLMIEGSREIPVLVLPAPNPPAERELPKTGGVSGGGTDEARKSDDDLK